MDESLHIVCPHCETVNRLPAARVTDAARCGRCREPLQAAKPLALGAASFERYISRSDLPVAVDFWAPWCGPCRSMEPEFERAAAQLGAKALLAKVNTEAEPALAERFAIRSIPTLVLFKSGREVARQSGALREADIVRWITAHSG